MEALATDRAAYVSKRFAERNRISAAFFPQDSERLARACQAMAERFLRVPCDYVPRIQDIQASTYHILLELQETAP